MTNDQIRESAPASLRALNRAVSLKDYADLTLSVTGVGKANANAAVWTSVTVYMAPSRTALDSDLQPGLDEAGDPTLEWTNLQTDVETFLEMLQEDLVEFEITPLINNSKNERKEYISKIIAYLDDYDEYVHSNCVKLVNMFNMIGTRNDEHKKNLNENEKKLGIALIDLFDNYNSIFFGTQNNNRNVFAKKMKFERNKCR